MVASHFWCATGNHIFKLLQLLYLFGLKPFKVKLIISAVFKLVVVLSASASQQGHAPGPGVEVEGVETPRPYDLLYSVPGSIRFNGSNSGA